MITGVSAQDLISNKLAFHGCDIHARLKACNIFCEKGQFWHVLGANGSGKSTLLLALSGLLPYNKLSYNQTDIAELSLIQQARIRALLSQKHASEFEVSLRQLLRFFTEFECLPEQLDATLELNGLLHKPLNKLSGGQQQRFHIARAVMQILPSLEQGKGILILDEPLQGLDIKHQFNVLDMLNNYSRLGNAVIMSCHDINVSLKYATHAIMLLGGQVIAQGEASQCLTTEYLSKVFDVRFLAENGQLTIEYDVGNNV